jgi:hypothetical protein
MRTLLPERVSGINFDITCWRCWGIILGYLGGLVFLGGFLGWLVSEVVCIIIMGFA